MLSMLDQQEYDIESSKISLDTRMFKTAAITMLALTLHNLPEGLAVAVSTLDSQPHGITIALAVALHNIPEGLAIATPILASTKNPRKAMIWTACSGMSEPLGAIFAVSVLGGNGISRDSLRMILCLVAGMMSAVSIKELIPQGIRYNQPWHMLKGAIIGAVLMFVDLYAFPQ